jgi:hypothetical protein
MSKQEHPWVQDANSYEAVLCCLNNVHDWDQAATIRAYQTFGFDDASTPGNDQSYRHEDTGVMVLHDGDVVAIQFGDGNLVAALGDLFRVLNSLGWQKAEVYHPAHTMGALLTDMGNAIPAHMDFDVTAAKQDSGEVSQLPEAVALMERGRNLLQGLPETKADADFHELALGELQSMEPAFGEAAGADHEPMPEATGPIAEEAAMLTSRTPTPARSGRPVFLDDDEAAPMVPVLGDAAVAPVAPTPTPAPARAGIVLLDDEPDWEPSGGWPGNVVDEPISLAADSHAEPRPVQSVQEMDAAHGNGAEQSPKAPTLDALGSNSMIVPAATRRAQSAATSSAQQPAADDAVARRTVRVGKSAMYFSEPGDELSQDMVTRLSDQLGATEVVNAWPGLLDQRDRWDVLGEVDLQAPWTAQLLVNGFGLFDAAGGACFAADLVRVARAGRDDGRPQLRDVMQFATEGKGATMTAVLATADAAAYQRAMSELIAGLAVADAGSAFVDVRDTQGEGAPESNVRPFTIRSLMQDAVPKLYVIHRDAIDGPFVVMLIRALGEVASAYASSVRIQRQAAAVLAEQERQMERDRVAKQEAEQRQQAAAQILKMMSGLKSQLQTLGVEVPEA